MRRGSALLIVLGMLSFMLFSGIAFSVYMRQTRLPSSFLRRTTTTRQLTKAALAEAMREIDLAIGNDPHPGVPANDSSDVTAGSCKYRNYWDNRVFWGRTSISTNWTTCADAHKTISTLSLEGLAYLPPSLINEVRYYSRRTPTAEWRKFRFEAGRYAYTAIDVSDYFDVNRIFADYPRSSASVRRVTLSHIFETAGSGGLHGAPMAGKAEEWDTAFEQIRELDENTGEIRFNGMPLVSLADFNLFLGTRDFGEGKVHICSPFVKNYMTGSDDSTEFYTDHGDGVDDPTSEGYRSMTFVTDSHFRAPIREAGFEEYDLENSDNQPFDPADLKRGVKMPLPTLMSKVSSRPRGNEYLQYLSRLGMATLYDYLDEDSKPVSLTLPTVERNPMICAIKTNFENLPFSVSRTDEPLKDAEGNNELDDQKEKENYTKRTVSQSVVYAIDGGELGMGLAGKQIEALALFPFLHVENPGSFPVDGKVALFLSRGGDNVNLASNDGNSVFEFGDEPPGDVTLNETTGVLEFPLSGATISPASVKTIDNALLSVNCTCRGARNISSKLLANGDRYWVKFTYRWDQTREGKDRDTYTEWKPKFEEAEKYDNLAKDRSGCRMWPIDADGETISDLKKIWDDFHGEVKYKLNAAVWLRVRKGSDTVDLVPACIYDDKDQRVTTMNVNAIKVDQYLRNYYYNRGSCIEGMGRHIMRFDLNSGTDFIPGKLSGKQSYTLTSDPKAVMVADPRYNHNPANWFGIDGDLKTEWKAAGNNPYASRDGDVFMSVSDQGYLQSIYELGFLPRLTNANQDKEPIGGFRPLSGAKTDRFCTSFGETQQRDLMWNTYRPYRRGGTAADPFDRSDFQFVSGVRGQKIDPYSESLEILAAAFANTPQDWAHASTNATMNTHCDDSVDTFNQKYAWNAYNSGGSTRLMWSDLQNLGDAFYDKVRNNGSDGWETAFANLDWSTSSREILNGVELDSRSSDVYSVDKKFLYGFWHDCFSANQQLFLIFVRAEPMMMGGGVAGNAPPQLSSRAVALVWRNPERRSTASESQSTQSDSYIPHQMRVLFYHPLD